MHLPSARWSFGCTEASSSCVGPPPAAGLLPAIDARCPRRRPAGEDRFRATLPLPQLLPPMGSVRPTCLELAWLGSHRPLDGFLGPDLDLESMPQWRREDAFAVRRHGRRSASPPVTVPVAAWERITLAAGYRPKEDGGAP
ncbi:hypothetical protein ACLOJK_014667 [Asimina triloba]